MITSAHMRMARAGLGWNLQNLAERSGVNPNTISRFEGGKDIMSSKLRQLEAVLLQAGVEFIEEAGVIGVRVPRLAKSEAQPQRRRKPRIPKKSD